MPGRDPDGLATAQPLSGRLRRGAAGGGSPGHHARRPGSGDVAPGGRRAQLDSRAGGLRCGDCARARPGCGSGLPSAQCGAATAERRPWLRVERTGRGCRATVSRWSRVLERAARERTALVIRIDGRQVDRRCRSWPSDVPAGGLWVEAASGTDARRRARPAAPGHRRAGCRRARTVGRDGSSRRPQRGAAALGIRPRAQHGRDEPSDAHAVRADCAGGEDRLDDPPFGERAARERSSSRVRRTATAQRADRAFIAINCAALTESLLESGVVRP